MMNFRLARNTKLLTFAKPGGQGAKFKGPFEKMMKALSIPKPVREELGITDEAVGDETILQNKPAVDAEDAKLAEEDGEDKSNLVKRLLSEGKYHILPSFFKTLVTLKKLKREFAVVFRDYNGQDLDNVVAEFNQFCKGEHPCFSGKNGTILAKFDGSKGAKEMRIRERNQRAVSYRAPQSRLVAGARNRALKGENPDEFHNA